MRMRFGLPTIMILLGLTALFMMPAPAGAGGGGGTAFYLSVGTSLSVGIEPNAAGHNRRTQEGYADQLHGMVSQTVARLGLVKLGCPGETSVTMIYGGTCAYDAGSQLAQAVQFLHDHQGSVAFVTIDVGANDIEPCGLLTGLAQQICVTNAIGNVTTNLPQILGVLRGAAGSSVPIVAMNYYNPFLAAWFVDPAQAQASTQLQQLFNGLLQFIYSNAFGIPVADVAGVFESYNTAADPVTGIPINVLRICQLTWMCAPPPVGPNIHANILGYGVIAEAFVPVLPALP